MLPARAMQAGSYHELSVILIKIWLSYFEIDCLTFSIQNADDSYIADWAPQGCKFCTF